MGLVGSEKNLLDAMKQAKSSTDGVFKIVVLQAAQVHATPELAASAVEWIGAPAGDDTLRVYMWAARVVGWGGTKGLEDKLLKLLDAKETRVYAALAIALGGDEDLVRRGMVTFEQKSRGEPDGAERWKTELNSLRDGIHPLVSGASSLLTGATQVAASWDRVAKLKGTPRLGATIENKLSS